MGREVNRLSARRVATLTEIGRHADGGGLYLVVDAAGAKRWVMLFRFGGKRREMGLGPLGSVPLGKAREMAAAARELIAGGVDPIEARRTQPEAVAAPKIVTFGEVAEGYMADHKASWKNEQHRWQWRQTLEVQAAHVWKMPVADVTTDDVLKVLRPIWHEKPETARRLRGRIERVLSAAKANKLRTGENPAMWRGHLDMLLPKAKRLSRGHHAALSFPDVPAFVAMLRERPATTARALEFLILTAARSGEVRGMTWGEVNFRKAEWTVPSARMKMGREHVVPLSDAAMALLLARKPSNPDPNGLVFANGHGKMLSDMAFEALLRRAKQVTITAHGFRSSFRDWAGDETDHPREVAEAALAHLVGDSTELAYRRAAALKKRRALMDDWAQYVSPRQHGRPPAETPRKPQGPSEG